MPPVESSAYTSELAASAARAAASCSLFCSPTLRCEALAANARSAACITRASSASLPAISRLVGSRGAAPAAAPSSAPRERWSKVRLPKPSVSARIEWSVAEAPVSAPNVSN